MEIIRQARVMILLSESRTQAKNHRNKTKEDNLYCSYTAIKQDKGGEFMLQYANIYNYLY